MRKRERQSSVGIPGWLAGRHGRVLRPIAPEHESGSSAARFYGRAGNRASASSVGRNARTSQGRNSRIRQESSRKKSRQTRVARSRTCSGGTSQGGNGLPLPCPNHLHRQLPRRLSRQNRLRAHQLPRRPRHDPRLRSPVRSPSLVEHSSTSGWSTRFQPNAADRVTPLWPRSTSLW